MRKILMLSSLLFGSCVKTGPEFINCSRPDLGRLAVDISVENMVNVQEVVSGMNFSCREEITYPANMACFLVRPGTGIERGLIVLLDEHIGECVIHELYHAELSTAYSDPCSSHQEDCYWDSRWLETLLEEYKEIKGATH